MSQGARGKRKTSEKLRKELKGKEEKMTKGGKIK